MKYYLRYFLIFLYLAIIASGLLYAQDGPAGEPIDNMHHFMEYVFEPRYKELKRALVAEPVDKQTWNKIKVGSLTLAEAANLLITRPPDEAQDDQKALWSGYARDVRSEATAVFQAARKKQFTSVRDAFHSTIQKCNACHQMFTEGKYQLEP
jgi:cytochrome c556